MTVSPSYDLGIEGFEDAVEIGHGGFAVVYRARQPALNRQVAVKVLSASLDPSSRERFAREGFAIGTFSGHPHIVTVLGTGVTREGRPYMAMAYLSRGSLADRLDRDGPLPWPEAVRTGIKLAGALETAHRVGTLHRDVKPENVLVTDYGEPQLADFGIARVQGRFETSSGHVLASVSFAAPEVLDGKAASVASDVYSLAATIFALVAGAPPFPRGRTEELVALYLRIATAPLPDLRPLEVPETLCEALEEAMAKEPGARPCSAAALGHLLQQAEREAGLPVTEMVVASQRATEETRDDVPRPGLTVLEIQPRRLLGQVRSLLRMAGSELVGTATAERIAGLEKRLDQRLRVAVMGGDRAAQTAVLHALGELAAAFTLVYRGDDPDSADAVIYVLSDPVTDGKRLRMLRPPDGPAHDRSVNVVGVALGPAPGSGDPPQRDDSVANELCLAVVDLAALDGTEELQRVVRAHLIVPADVLRARSALIAVDHLVGAHPAGGSGRLRAEIERTWAGAHELNELELLADCTQGRSPFAPEEAAEAECLLGARGSSVALRLGLPPEASTETLRQAATESAHHWHRRAEHPLSSSEMAAAARLLAHSCEGILSALP